MTLQDYYDALDAAKRVATGGGVNALAIPVLHCLGSNYVPQNTPLYLAGLDVVGVSFVGPGRGVPGNGYISVELVFPPLKPLPHEDS